MNLIGLTGNYLVMSLIAKSSSVLDSKKLQHGILLREGESTIFQKSKMIGLSYSTI